VIVSHLEPLAPLSNLVSDILIEALIKIHLRDSMHGALRGNEVNEVVALEFNPHLVGASQVKLDNDSVKEVVMTSADFRFAERINPRRDVRR
jgi:hypothetical protein